MPSLNPAGSAGFLFFMRGKSAGAILTVCLEVEMIKMKQKYVWVLLFLLLGSCFLMAHEKDGQHYCDLCNEQITKTIYTFHDRAIGGEVKMCKSCAEIKKRCFLCGLPVLSNSATLID